VPDWVSRIEWLAGRCIERSFLLRRRQGTVPGVLWSPQTMAPHGTVLLFHGGTELRLAPELERLGRCQRVA
jgi:hypothetical protein